MHHLGTPNYRIDQPGRRSGVSLFPILKLIELLLGERNPWKIIILKMVTLTGNKFSFFI
jgi:hypothetical protein